MEEVIEHASRAWSCEALCGVAVAQTRLVLGERLRAHLVKGEVFLAALLTSRVRVYGLTTGFGPLATTLVPPEQREALQRHLIAHLATGTGPLLDYEQSRAVLFARLVTLSQGYSCAPVALVEQMIAMLNAGLAPVIPRYGTVGASGDLTPLAHMARGLMGEGELWTSPTTRALASDALRSHHLTPLVPRDREGLALVNGTSVMTAVAAASAVRMSKMMSVCVDLAVAYGEVMRAHPGAWSPLLGVVRGQPGQSWVHEQLGARMASSERMATQREDRLIALPEEVNGEGVSPGQPLVQDAYSLRCVPQLLGAIRDVMTWHREVVERELVAVTDNPIFDVEHERVVHGGNFYGQHVAMASDALKTAVVKMMVWLERVAARLCDATRSQGLTPFLVWRPDSVGLQSGFMGAQVTASALVALARTRGVPASIQSISTNAGNQDVVTMGTIAAMECDELCERASELVAIVAMMIAQAMELRDESLKGFASSSVALHERVRRVSPRLEEDRSLSEEIAQLARGFHTLSIL